MAGPSPSAFAIDSAPSPAMRRSFTLPARLAEDRTATTANAVAGAGSKELLFSHDSKIVAFNPSDPISVGGVRADPDVDQVGVLPWTFPTERTIAAGPLYLYRLHSIAFLSSGHILHAILPKSRCWCVDGGSKFVLRIRRNLYWRIELSGFVEDKAEELKRVFAGILQYETTPCPFKRDFTVELPEPPRTPPRKRPWKAPERPKPLKPERAPEPDSPGEYTTAPFDNGSAGEIGEIGEIEEESGSDTANIGDTGELTPNNGPPSYRLSTDRLLPFMKSSNIPGPRSITSPLCLAIETPMPPTPPSSVYSSLQSDEDTAKCPTLSSSVESFHSAQSLVSPSSPLLPDITQTSPTFSPVHHDGGIHIRRYRDHKRDTSNATAMAGSPILSALSNDGGGSSPPLTPALTGDHGDQRVEDWSEVLSPQGHDGLRNRHTHKRALSPLPLAANLISPTVAEGHLTGALIQKACSFMLGPPVQLISLMLRIAFKIANGALRGAVSGYGENGEEIICQWDYSDGDDTFEQGAWEEDDFGVPISGKGATAVRGGSNSEPWEVD